MRTVRVRWLPEADRFVVDGSHPNQSISVNAPHEGVPSGFSATELLLAGIGSCAAWDVVEILRKSRQRAHAVDVDVVGEQAAAAPWPYTAIQVSFTVRGRGLRRAAVERAVKLSCDRYCSVIATVRGVATVTSAVTIVNEPAPAA
jgi:putative redox protein